MSTLINQLRRFVGFGLINTVGSYGVYVVLLSAYSPQISFSVAFGVGLVLAFFFSSRLVFGVRPTIANTLMFGLIYLVAFGLGQLVLEVVGAVGLRDQVIAGLLATGLSAATTFAGARMLFRRGRRETRDG